MLRLSQAAKQLANHAQQLINLSDSGRLHMQGDEAAEASAISALDGLRAGIANRAALDAGQHPTPTITLPAEVLDDATLDQVSQFAGGTAGLGIEQTLTLILQMGLTAAQNEIANRPLRFILRAQELAEKCAKPPLNFVFMSGTSNFLHSDASDRRFFVVNNEAAQP